MSSDVRELDWDKIFKMLDQGISFRQISKELGTSISSIHREYTKRLEEKVRAQLQELGKVEGKTVESKKELARVRIQITELRKGVDQRGLTIEQALALLSKTKNLNAEIRALSKKKEAVASEVREMGEILPSLRNQKNDLEMKLRLLGEYNAQLQESYAGLTAWNINQRPQAEAHRAWIEAEIHRLDLKLRVLTERMKKLGREIEDKKRAGEKRIDEKAKEGEALEATFDKTTEKLAVLEREIEKAQDYLRELREEIQHVKLLRDIKGAVGARRGGVDELGEGIKKVGEVVSERKLPIKAALKLIKPSATS